MKSKMEYNCRYLGLDMFVLLFKRWSDLFWFIQSFLIWGTLAFSTSEYCYVCVEYKCLLYELYSYSHQQSVCVPLLEYELGYHRLLEKNSIKKSNNILFFRIIKKMYTSLTHPEILNIICRLTFWRQSGSLLDFCIRQLRAK